MQLSKPKASGTKVGRFSFLPFLLIVLLLPPGTSDSLAAQYVHASPIRLTWDAASGSVDHYNVYVSLNGQAFVEVAEVTDTLCQLDVEDGNQYVVQVDAENAGGDTSPKSDSSEAIFIFLNGSPEDTDGDGIPDTYEASNDLDPYNPLDSLEDPDEDDLVNREEFDAGTDPRDPDTDSDGVPDGTEVERSQDPVNPRDNIPVADAGDDAEHDPTVVTLDGSGSYDPTADPLSFTWTQRSGDPVELSGPNDVAPSFRGKKADDYVFELVVNDGHVDSLADEVVVTIRNIAPTADAGMDQVVDAGLVVELKASGSSDANEDPLAYGWTQTEGASVDLDGAQAESCTFLPEQSGVYRFELQVCDESDLCSATDEVVVIANAVNQVPTANAGPDQNVPLEENVVLDGSESSDPDEDGLTCIWIQTAGPVAIAFDDNTLVSPTVVFRQAGTYRFQLIVDDGTDSSVPDEVVITAADNNEAPVAVVAVVEGVYEGDQVVLDGTGSYDPDGDDLQYLWTQTGGPTVELDSSTIPAPTFYAVSQGVVAFELVVTDGELSSPAEGVEIIVDSDNMVPVVDAGPDGTATLQQAYCLDGSGSYDPDPEDTIQYSWSQVSGPRVTLQDANTVSPCFTPRNSGTYIFALTVFDGEVESVVGTVTVDAAAGGGNGGGGGSGGGGGGGGSGGGGCSSTGFPHATGKLHKENVLFLFILFSPVLIIVVWKRRVARSHLMSNAT